MKKILVCLTIIFAAASCDSGKNSTEKTTVDSASTSDNTNVATPDKATSHNLMMADMNQMMDSMKSNPSTGNHDLDFVNLMIEHHTAAVNMARTERSQGKDTAVVALANKIYKDQMSEILDFKSILQRGSFMTGKDDAFYKTAMASMDKMEMNMDHSAPVDKQFLQMMIPHHKSAIAMSLAYLQQKNNSPEIKTMAEKILTSQQQEIALMKKWLDK